MEAQQEFCGLKEVAQIFGVSHLTLQNRGIDVDDKNPQRGRLVIGRGTAGEIRLPLVRVGWTWTVPTRALQAMLRDLAGAAEAQVAADPQVSGVATATRRRGRPRKVGGQAGEAL